MNYKIAICITTFLRDNLLYKTLQSLIDNYPSNSLIMIADQGYNSDEKENYINSIKSRIPCEYYRLPFDCGAYKARNFLVQKATEMSIPYCLISADSIQFISKYDFQPIIDFLDQKERIALVGFELKGSKCSWEYNMDLTKNGFKFTNPDKIIKFKNINFIKLDICRNIYLAKTAALIDSKYDEDFKLGAHELNFWNLKQNGWDCYWTDVISFQRKSSMPKEYETYRKRLGYYVRLVKKKLNVSGWVIKPK